MEKKEKITLSGFLVVVVAINTLIAFGGHFFAKKGEVPEIVNVYIENLTEDINGLRADLKESRDSMGKFAVEINDLEKQLNTVDFELKLFRAVYEGAEPND